MNQSPSLTRRVWIEPMLRALSVGDAQAGGAFPDAETSVFSSRSCGAAPETPDTISTAKLSVTVRQAGIMKGIMLNNC